VKYYNYYNNIRIELISVGNFTCFEVVFPMMDAKDLLILSYLRKNGRLSLTNLAKHTSIPVSTLYERIKKLNAIKRYTSLLDFTKLGYDLNVTIMIRVRKDHKKLLREYALKCHCVNSAYIIDNGYDLVMECFFKNLQELYHFMDNIDEQFKQNKKEVFYIIEHLKKEEFLSDPISLKIRGLV